VIKLKMNWNILVLIWYIGFILGIFSNFGIKKLLITMGIVVGLGIITSSISWEVAKTVIWAAGIFVLSVKIGNIAVMIFEK
jgi:hypothetical protein